MEHITNFPTFDHPNYATVVAVLLATALVVLLGRQVVKVARRAGHFKPESLMLVVVPVAVIFAGTLIDDHRETQYREDVLASGAVDDSWKEIEDVISTKYNVSSVEPFGDRIELVELAHQAVHDGPGPVTPNVVVQMPESTYTEVYRLIVKNDAGALDVELERPASAVLMNEGVDPERLLITQ